MNTITSIHKLNKLLFLFILTIYFVPTGSFSQQSIFKFIRTVQITPDAKFPNYKNGALGYIHYIPQTDRFAVMISTFLNQPEGGYEGKGVAFKEYSTTMQPTGRSWIINGAAADVTSQVIGNNLYLASMFAGETEGHRWMG